MTKSDPVSETSCVFWQITKTMSNAQITVELITPHRYQNPLDFFIWLVGPLSLNTSIWHVGLNGVYIRHFSTRSIGLFKLYCSEDWKHLTCLHLAYSKVSLHFSSYIPKAMHAPFLIDTEDWGGCKRVSGTWGTFRAMWFEFHHMTRSRNMGDYTNLLLHRWLCFLWKKHITWTYKEKSSLSISLLYHQNY